MYDDVRPGYPVVVGEAIAAFHGRPPASVVELGAGTGKGTALLSGLGGMLTCVEPDPRMAAVLRAKFPQASVAEVSFEEWAAPAGGVDLIGCALAWHWLDPATRNQRAHAALAPGGTLAVFGHRYGYRDQAVADTVARIVSGVIPTTIRHDPNWMHDDIAGSGVFGEDEVEQQFWHTYPEFTRKRFLQLVQTFGPYRQLSAEDQRTGLERLARALPGTVTLDLRTTLVLGRRS